MAAPEWVITRISRAHDRSGFDSGYPALDSFLEKYARQKEKKGITRTYVAVQKGRDQVRGYYTVRVGHVEFSDLSPDDVKGLPRYPIPVLHIARLAVTKAAQGEGLGERLLHRALCIAMAVSDQVGLFAVEVLAKDENARAYYEKYGFKALPVDELHMYLSMNTLRKVLPAG